MTPPDDVSIHLLGGFSVAIDDRVVRTNDFERRAGAELVQVLALSPGHRLHREQVIDRLWPDADLSAGMNRLNKASTFARKALGADDAIVVSTGTVALFPHRETVIDVEAIERIDTSDPGSIDRAMSAYAGDLLPDSPYSEWATAERDRLRFWLLDALSETERWDDLVALDDTNEEAHVALMRRSLADGRHQQVLDRFDFLEQRLDAALGVLPGRAAVALRDQARSAMDGTDAGLRGVVAVIGSGPAPPASEVATTDVVEWLGAAAEDTGGRVLTTADGVWAEFASAGDAVDGTIRLLRRITGERADDGPTAVRLGVDLGPVGPGDAAARSDASPVLARSRALAELASPGEALCSASVVEMTPTPTAPGARMTDLGLVDLPGHRPTPVHRLIVDGPPRGRDDPRLFAGRRLTGRPVSESRSRLIGRDREMAELVNLLRHGRLVSITGPGGAGKTHLARAVAAQVAESFEGGAWWASLGATDDSSAALRLVLDAIGGLHHADADVVESVCRTLGTRDVLLVLDNCEHVTASMTELVVAVLDRCPGVTMMATTRVDLGLPEEVTYSLGSLDHEAARRLFVAEAARHHVTIAEDDRLVERICDRLDGLPLAVRLAAGRTRSLELPTLASMLDESFDLLASSDAGVPDHQRTLNATIAWSYDALTIPLRETLSDLAVMAGPFDIETALAVADRGGDRAELVAQIDGLVRRSLVIGPAHGRGRFRLLESVRLFARNREVDASARLRHLDHFVTAAEAARRIQDDDADAAIEWFRANWDDLRLARLTAVEHGRLDDVCRLVVAAEFYGLECLVVEVVEWCDHDLGGTFSGDTPVRAAALGVWATLLLQRTELDRALAVLGRVADEQRDLAAVRFAQAWAFWSQADIASTRTELEAMVRENRDSPAPLAEALVFLVTIALVDRQPMAEWAYELEVVAAGRGTTYRCMDLLARAVTSLDDPRAVEYLAECRELADTHRLTTFSSGARGALVVVLARTERLAATVHEGIAWMAERGQWLHCLSALGGAADLLERAGRADLAVTIRAARQANGFATTYSRVTGERLREATRSAHGEQADRWWEVGARLDKRGAARVALVGLEEAFGLRPR